jgi:peroxiredoxin
MPEAERVQVGERVPDFTITNHTPAILKRYASSWTTNQATWAFGTSSRDEIGIIASYFGLIHERAATGLIDHDLRTALISPEGKLVHIWKSNFWNHPRSWLFSQTVIEEMHEF